MAAVMSAKRPRALTSGIGSAAGNSRNKRPRHDTPEISDNSSEDDDGKASSDDESADDGDDAQEQEQMQWATQRVQRDFKATANKKNTETDSGIIEEIQCINFMCHEHLTVTLGPLINFIIGHNGSGKSAVLTALTICLGGKATATNRAQNLKSLIKEGKDHCSVQVRIKNQGPLAYKPAYYGKSITVERHFTRSGVSGFKLKDANGKIVSTKKAELEDILDAFSMQIDNPMNVLTQDMARQFLNHSTPKDKYRFFLQGTQLENLSRDYLQIEQSLELMNTRAEVKKADIGQLRKRMEDLAAKARRAESLEKMRAREKEIVHQALWAKVEAQEQEVVRADTELEKHARVIDRRQELVQEASDAYDRSNQASDAAQQEVTDLTVQREPAKQEALALKTVFDDSKAKLFVLKADERTITADISAKGKLVVKHKAEIKALERRQEEADNGLHAAKKKELDDAKEECERANAANSMYGDELPGIQAEMQTAQANAQSTEQNLRRAQDGERQIRNNIQQLRGGQRNWIDAYQKPGNLDKLLQAIGNDRSFREKPVGPMGRHVTLLQSEWGYILEKQFGAALNAFVVTSRADQARLSDLMKRCNWSATIYIGKSAPMDTQQHEPAPELLTWLRALKIDDHLVRNQLIINQQIDQVVLIGERAKGADFMHGRDSNTRNVKMCFTFADGDRRKGRLYNYTSSGGVNNSPIDEYRGQLRMQADKEDQIRGEQARHDATKREVRDLEQALRHAVHQVDECKGKELDYVRRKKQLKIELQRAQSTVDRLEGELSDSTPDAAAIEVLQESLTNAEVELGRAEKLYEDMVIQVDQLDVVIRENKTRLEAAQRIEKELDFKLTKAQATVKKYQSQREEDLRSKNSAIAQVTAAESNRALWEEAQRDAQADLDAKVLEAQAECPERVPVPTGKDTKALLKQLAGLQATRRLAEKELGSSQADILRQANEAKKIHQEARREFDDIEGLKSHFSTTLNHRRNRWLQFRSGISVRARVTFNYLLSERKFRGTLSIDHKKSLLDIHVQPDITERSGDGRQTKTLSGGEKSYSTVCLLLALWDAMGSPIRCLDEFDVFMDSVNRERSMQMIIQAARRSIGRQFIFITPQSMNNVQLADDVKIIRMSDPERNQTALNFRGK